MIIMIILILFDSGMIVSDFCFNKRVCVPILLDISAGFNLADRFTIAAVQGIAKRSPACAFLVAATRTLLGGICAAAAANSSVDYNDLASAYL